MAKYLFSMIFLLISNFTFAQHQDKGLAIALEEVERPPLYKRCKEKWDSKKQRDCTSMNINDFVNYRFNMKLATKLLGKGAGKLEANFIINQEGHIEVVSVTGGPEELNQHLREVLLSLKKFKPGMQNGSQVDVSVHLPVSFRIF